MKLKDFVYDPDLKKATLMLEEVEPVQLENLRMLLEDENTSKEENGPDYMPIIFGEEN